MKIVEITSNIKVAITNEEADVLTKFDDETPTVAKSDLDERQQILANQLVNKDVLQRKNENGRIIYKKRTG
jgi:pheromone shutdown protein TraB